MRNSLVLLASAVSVQLFAQGFALFNADSKKLFTGLPEQRVAYDMAFDSVAVTPSSTIFFPYKDVRFNPVPSQCGWWVGDSCYPQDRPTWLGASVVVTNDGTHTFHNVWNEPVAMNFGTDPQDTAIIYSDATQQFLMAFDQESTSEILGEQDIVRTWTILHRDLAGNPIASALNGSQVIVGENLGIVQFFRVDSFPAVLEVVDLIGQVEPQLGFYKITPAILNDFQVGDEVQSHHYAHYYTGPPWQNYDFVSKWTVLGRMDSPDSVTYTMQTETIYPDSAAPVEGTTTVRYSKYFIIAQIPFQRFNGTSPSLKRKDYCGQLFWTYRTNLNQGLAYCETENCWGPYDTNGPPPVGGTTHVLGIGVYQMSSAIWQPTGYTVTSDVVYFRKNGISCGSELTVGMHELSGRDAFTVNPNPFGDRLSVGITGKLGVVHLELISLTGQVLLDETGSGTEISLQTSELPLGSYILRLSTGNACSAIRVVKGDGTY